MVTVAVKATPTLVRRVGWRGVDPAVVVTASHNPPTDNGFKFWTPGGRAFDAERGYRTDRNRVAYDYVS